MHAQGFNARVTGCTVLFGYEPVFFAKFNQCFDMLRYKRNRRDQNILPIFRGLFDLFFCRRPYPFERPNAGLVAGNHFPIGGYTGGDHLAHCLALPLIWIAILHNLLGQTVRGQEKPDIVRLSCSLMGLHDAIDMRGNKPFSEGIATNRLRGLPCMPCSIP